MVRKSPNLSGGGQTKEPTHHDYVVCAFAATKNGEMNILLGFRLRPSPVRLAVSVHAATGHLPLPRESPH